MSLRLTRIYSRLVWRSKPCTFVLASRQENAYSSDVHEGPDRVPLLEAASGSPASSRTKKKVENQGARFKKATSIHPFKRINWENSNLFGPLLRRRTTTVDECRRSSKLSSPSSRKVILRVIENGFKSIDGPPMARLCHSHEVLFKVVQPSQSTEPAVEVKMEAEINAVDNVDLDYLPESIDILPNVSQRTPKLQLDLNELLRKFPLSGDYDDDLDETSFPFIKHWLPDRTKPDTWPSVTAILQATMSAESQAVLKAWKDRMVAKLGVQGFSEYQRELFIVGRDLHGFIQDYLSGEAGLADIRVDDNDRPALAGHWRSLCAVLPHISDVHFLETRVKHPHLCYTGIVDCVAKYRGVIVVIEWKTSQRPKATLAETYDNPLQAIAYLGALRATQRLENADDLQMDGAIIVVASAGGSPAHVHFINEDLCEHYWKLWLQRLCKYHSPTGHATH